MTAFVGRSVLIDYLRGHPAAAQVLEGERAVAALHASEITRLEVLAGMRPFAEGPTRSLSTLRWLPTHRGIDGADLAIAATALLLDARLVTRNVRRFAMFPGLQAPY